ncbi:MAG: oxygenase MpaB family protein [Leucobacter sp.]
MTTAAEAARSTTARSKTAPSITALSTTAAQSTPSEGAAQTATDEGYFGPDSVSWRVFSDPSSKLGGFAALLLQSLNPNMMRLFDATSGYAADVEGRSERTGRYLDTTIFGDREHADAAGEAVQRLHAASMWTDPKTGEELRADTQEWLAWTHNALVFGLLRAADEFGPKLTAAEQDRFVLEQHEAARIVGVTEEELLPRTRGELEEYLDDNKSWMSLTLPAAEISRSLRKPALKGNPVKVWLGLNVQDATLGLLPDWALLLFGIEGRPMNMRAATRVTRRLIAQARAGRSAADLISEVTSRVETHPYQKVRRPRAGA